MFQSEEEMRTWFEMLSMEEKQGLAALVKCRHRRIGRRHVIAYHFEAAGYWRLVAKEVVWEWFPVRRGGHGRN